MSDLGSIGFTPAAIPQEQESSLAGVSRGLAETAAIVKTGLDENQLRNLKDDLDGQAAEAVQGVENPALPEEKLGTTFASTEEQQLFDNLQRYQRQIAQGSSSVRSAVINRAKREASNAMAKNPSLRSKIAAEYNLFVGTNPDLDALGLSDQASGAGGKLAQKQYDEIFDNAYGDVKDGGLGIPAHIEFGSPAFVKRYVKASALEEEVNTNTLFLNTLTSREEVDVRTMGPAIEKALNGVANNVDATFNAQQAQLTEISSASQRVSTGSGSPEDEQLLVAFETRLSGDFQAGFEGYKAELVAIKNSIPAGQQNSDYGKAIIKKIDDNIDYVQRWQDASAAMGTNPTLVKAMEIESQIRKNEFRREQPDAERLIYDINQMKPLLENAEVIGLDDRLFEDDLGNLVIPTIQDWLTDSYNFGAALRTDDNMTRDDIRQSARRRRTVDPQAYGVDTDSEDGRPVEAILRLVNANKRRDDAYAVYVNNGIDIPEPIFSSYAAEMAHVGELADGQNYEPDTINRIQQMYTAPRSVDTIKALRAQSLSPSQANTIGALGDELIDYYNSMPNGGPEARKLSVSREYENRFGGVAFSDMVTPDWSKLNEGQVSFAVNPQAGANVVAASAANSPASRFTSGTTTQRDIQKQQREIIEYSEYLASKISQELQFVGNANFFRNTSLKAPNYVATWDAEGFDVITQRPGER